MGRALGSGACVSLPTRRQGPQTPVSQESSFTVKSNGWPFPLYQLTLKTLETPLSVPVNLNPKLTLSFIKPKSHRPPSLVWTLCMSPLGVTIITAFPSERPHCTARAVQCWPCPQNDFQMPNSHLDERACPVPEQKRRPVTLPAQRPCPLPRPTTLPFSFGGTTLAPFSGPGGNVSGQ